MSAFCYKHSDTFKKMPTNALYYSIKFLQLKHWNSDMFRPVVGHRQGVYISICMKCRL